MGSTHPCICRSTLFHNGTQTENNNSGMDHTPATCWAGSRCITRVSRFTSQSRCISRYFHQPHFADRIWGTETSSHLTEVTQLRSGQTWMWAQVSPGYMGSTMGHTVSGQREAVFLMQQRSQTSSPWESFQGFWTIYPLVMLLTYLGSLQSPNYNPSCFMSPLNQRYTTSARGSLDMLCVFF